MFSAEGHSTVIYQKHCYIFGGYDLKREKSTNELHRVDVSDILRNVRDKPTSKPVGASMPFGGSSGVGRFGKIDEVSSVLVATTGPCPSPRAFHACTLRGPYMIVWGGTVDPSGFMGSALPPADGNSEGRDASSLISTFQTAKPSSVSDKLMELFSLNLDTLIWTRYFVPSAAPEVLMQAVPQQRCHATMITTEDAILLYGGYAISKRGDSDDIAAAQPNEWCVFRVRPEGAVEAQEVQGAAPALWGHSCVYAHRCAIVFGGVDAVGDEEVGTLCVYNIDEKRWRWAEFPIGPCARALHSAVVDPEGGFMVVFGGFTSSSPSGDEEEASGLNSIARQLNDVWSFSLCSGLWDQWDLGGGFPSPNNNGDGALRGEGTLPTAPRGRSGHSAVIHEGFMFVFGGLINNEADSNSQGGSSPMRGLTQTAQVRKDEPNLLILDLTQRTWTQKLLFSSKASNVQDAHNPRWERGGPSSSRNATALFGRAASEEMRDEEKHDDLSPKGKKSPLDRYASSGGSVIDRYLSAGGGGEEPLQTSQPSMPSTRQRGKGSSIVSRLTQEDFNSPPTRSRELYSSPLSSSSLGRGNPVLSASAATAPKVYVPTVAASSNAGAQKKEAAASYARYSVPSAVMPSPVKGVARSPEFSTPPGAQSFYSPTRTPSQREGSSPWLDDTQLLEAHPLGKATGVSLGSPAEQRNWGWQTGTVPTSVVGDSLKSMDHGGESQLLGSVVSKVNQSQRELVSRLQAVENERRVKLLQQFIKPRTPAVSNQSMLFQDDEELEGSPVYSSVFGRRKGSFSSGAEGPAVSGSPTPVGVGIFHSDPRYLVPAARTVPSATSQVDSPADMASPLSALKKSPLSTRHVKFGGGNGYLPQTSLVQASLSPPSGRELSTSSMEMLDDDEVPFSRDSHPLSAPWRK